MVVDDTGFIKKPAGVARQYTGTTGKVNMQMRGVGDQVPDPRRSIRCGKATGLDHLPSTSMQINAAWCVAATIACDLLCWLRLLCLDRSLADAEPKTLRYRILHTAVRLVRGQRKRKIKIPEAWPWARELEAAFLAAFALPAPT